MGFQYSNGKDRYKCLVFGGLIIHSVKYNPRICIWRNRQWSWTSMSISCAPVLIESCTCTCMRLKSRTEWGQTIHFQVQWWCVDQRLFRTVDYLHLNYPHGLKIRNTNSIWISNWNFFIHQQQHLQSHPHMVCIFHSWCRWQLITSNLLRRIPLGLSL